MGVSYANRDTLLSGDSQRKITSLFKMRMNNPVFGMLPKKVTEIFLIFSKL